MNIPAVPLLKLMSIKTICGFEYVKFTEIIRLEADCKHTLFFCKNRIEHIRSMLSLHENEEKLPAELFFKCHRSHIINLKYLHVFVKADREVHLTNGYIVVISEDRVAEFLLRTEPVTKKK